MPAPRHSGSVRELQKYVRSSEVSMSALRILVADDHEVVRRGLCVLLKSHAGWEVCAEAADGREASISDSVATLHSPATSMYLPFGKCCFITSALPASDSVSSRR